MTFILRATPATAQLLNYQNGDLTDFDSTPALAVVDGAGATVTTEPVAHPTTGIYQAVIPAQANLTLLEATWTGTLNTRALIHTVNYEIVGSTLADEAMIRAFAAKASGLGALSNTSDYTDGMIEEARERAITVLEQWTERSWIPRYCRVEVPGGGGNWLYLGDGEARLADGTPIHRPGRLSDVSRIISCKVDGATVSTSNLKIDATLGGVYRTDATWTAATSSSPLNVIIEYEYGLAHPVDGSERILMQLVRDDLVPSLISDRTLSMTTELGTERYVTAGIFGAVSNLPEVNAWVQAHTRHLPIG